MPCLPTAALQGSFTAHPIADLREYFFPDRSIQVTINVNRRYLKEYFEINPKVYHGIDTMILGFYI
jgi:hypothetical protein